MEIRERLDDGSIKTYAITNNVRYKIHKVGTDEIYDEAIDLPDDIRISKGLPLFYYEETITEVEDISTKN